MFRLVEPAAEYLASYEAALRQGWSSNSGRDVSGIELARLTADPVAFAADMARREGGTVTLADGAQVPRLPGRVLWMWDGELCGTINVRLVPGTTELPEHVSGHIGYAVVPWKRGRGYAKQALGLMLQIAASLGLPHAIITCDVGNAASRAVILANGGVLLRQAREIGHDNLIFHLPLPGGG